MYDIVLIVVLAILVLFVKEEAADTTS